MYVFYCVVGLGGEDSDEGDFEVCSEVPEWAHHIQYGSDSYWLVPNTYIE